MKTEYAVSAVYRRGGQQYHNMVTLMATSEEEAKGKYVGILMKEPGPVKIQSIMAAAYSHKFPFSVQNN